MSKTKPDYKARALAMGARSRIFSVIVFRPNGHVDSGSGFVIKSDAQSQSSLILTSEHFLGAIDDVLRVRRMARGGGVEELPAAVVHTDAIADIAILSVPGLTGVSPLRFAPESTSSVGLGIVAVGYTDPDNLFPSMAFMRIPTISPGQVRSKEIDHGTRGGITLYRIRLNCVTMHGMSGGPIVSKRGIVGMIDSGERGLTWAVSPLTILQFLKMYLGLGIQDNLTMTQVIDLIEL